MDALERFRKEFKGWVRSHNQIKEFNTDPDEILGRLENKIPESNLRQIGAAFINGWLENEPEEDRRYFVRESDRPGLRGGQWMLEHAGSGNVNPCWELYVQMADYSRIRTVAEKHGMTTRLEDGLLDITVYAGNKMVLYVENKKEKSQALHLLDRMHKYGESGFSMDDPDKGNDPLRKSKYLIRGDAFPEYFGLSAIDYEKMFQVEYHDTDNRFTLHEIDMSLTEPLLNAVVEGEPRPHSVVDPLALEIDHLLGDKVWVSPGSGQTAFNFYLPTETGDAIFLGVYEDGRVWSHIKTIGKVISDQLAGALSYVGISLDTSKEWAFWKRKGATLKLQDEDPLEIARIVAGSISLY